MDEGLSPVDGLPEALATGLEVGVEVVPGVEFSAEYLGTSVHILCYWMHAEDPALQLELRRLRDDRYSELRTAETAALPKVEMSYIGG